MSIDQYALCPCGNGKKIKFCKCKDSVSLMDQVLNMVNGGQVVPALDRLKSIITEHPDAAWALAIRGRLLIGLGEHETLKDNAEHFIRLQPANPIALSQMAVVRLTEDNLPAAADLTLEAFSESSDQIEASVIDNAFMVALNAYSKQRYFSAQVYAMLCAGSDTVFSQQALSALSQMYSSPNVHQLMKEVPELLPHPKDADWAERYEEAKALFDDRKILLADSKFESLKRSGVTHPAVLSGLLQCAVWRCDEQRQQDLALQLSQDETLDVIARQRLRAIADLLAEEPGVSTSLYRLRANFPEVSEAEMALTAEDQIEAMTGQDFSGLELEGQEVPPRSGFSVIQATDDGKFKSVVGSLFLYGRQTDREPELICVNVVEADLDYVKSAIGKALRNAEITADKSNVVPLWSFPMGTPSQKEMPENPVELKPYLEEFANSTFGQRVCSVSLPLLGGKSLAETASDDALLFERQVVVRLLEGRQLLQTLKQPMQYIYETAKIDPLPELEIPEDQLGSVKAIDLDRVKMDGIGFEGLLWITFTAQHSGQVGVVNRWAGAAIEYAKSHEGDEVNAEQVVQAYTLWAPLAESDTAILDRLSEGIEYAEKHSIEPLELLMQRFEHRLVSADAEGFQADMNLLQERYGNNPQVIGMVQQIMMRYGLLSPDGRPRSAAPPAAAAAPGPSDQFTAAPAPSQGSSSGLWTPDSGSSAPSSDSGEGGGKLWVPGMD